MFVHGSVCFFAFKIDFIFFLNRFIINETKYRVPKYLPPPHIHKVTHPSLSTSLTRVVHLLQLVNPHWFIIIIQIPWFTLGFTIDAVHSMGFNNFIMSHIYHYSIIQCSFTALKSPLYATYSSTYPSGNHWSFFLPALLRCNWQNCNLFKAYNMMIWYMYMPWKNSACGSFF